MRVVDDYYKGIQVLKPRDIAEQAFHIATLPAHVNITRLEVTPLCKLWAPLRVLRDDR